MNQNLEKKISKRLSYVLRHKPEAIGIELDESGWVSTEDLLNKLNEHGTPIDLTVLQRVVANNDKQRFSFNLDGTRIRANQGHSIDLDLQLTEKQPPDILYHGTAHKNQEVIRAKGILKMNRHHVHLSGNQETAINVGQRHGQPIVLEVNAGEMYANGHRFYVSLNGVWLTDHFPSEYLTP